jgi:surface polysaccharide O-acyltransferase-like enzyme
MVAKFLFVNGLAILGAVVFHTVGMGFVAMFPWAHRYLPAGVSAASQVGTPTYYALRLLEQVFIAAIPAFLVVSGYFTAAAAGRSGTNLTWRLVFSRTRGLLVPYLIWSAVVLMLRMAEGRRFTPGGLAAILLTGGANEVLYFVPFLIQFYLLSPLLVAWGRANARSLLLVAAALQMLMHASTYPVFGGLPMPFSGGADVVIPKWVFLARPIWFPLGIAIGLQPARYRDFAARFRSWWIPAALVLFVLSFVEWEFLYQRSGALWLPNVETPLDSLYSGAILFALLTRDVATQRASSLVAALGARSFGIYLTHAIFIEYTARLAYHFAPGLLGQALLLQLLLMSAGLFGPLALMALVNRLPVRHWHRFLFG